MLASQSQRTLLQPLLWRHNGRGSVSNHQPHDCLLNRLFRRRAKKTSKLRVTGFCTGNSPGTGAFPALMASNTENVFIWWRHHAEKYYDDLTCTSWYLKSLATWMLFTKKNRSSASQHDSEGKEIHRWHPRASWEIYFLSHVIDTRCRFKSIY